MFGAVSQEVVAEGGEVEVVVDEQLFLRDLFGDLGQMADVAVCDLKREAVFVGPQILGPDQSVGQRGAAQVEELLQRRRAA